MTVWSLAFEFPTEVATGIKAQARLEVPGAVNSLAFSPDGKTLAVGTSDFGAVLGSQAGATLWDTATLTKRTTFRYPQSADSVYPPSVNSVAISPNGRTLAIGSCSIEYDESSGDFIGRQGQVDLWDLATLRKKATLQDERGAFSTAFSPDSSILAVSLAGSTTDQDEVRLCDAETLEQRQTVECDFGLRHSLFYAEPTLAFSRDGTRLAILEEDRVILWHIGEDWTHTLAPLSQNEGCAVAFFPTGHVLAVNRGEIELWNIDLETTQTTLKHPPVWGGGTLAISSDGRRLAVAGSWESEGLSCGRAEVWDVCDGTRRATVDLLTDDTGICAVSFSPDGKTLVTGSENGWVWLWTISE
ncbi:MAG: hypothetical protein ABIP48_07255 [Planctomycetota bacterium]